MKPHNLTIVLLFLLVFSWKSYGQEINYGSNHGKHITISNTNIYYEEYGSGMPLLLFHGGFGSIHDFQQVIPKLSKHYRVIAVDSPGHGRSEQADSLSFDLMADYYSIMIDQFKLDSVYIIGYSDGGITALLLAEKRPDKVKKIIASGVNSRMDGITSEVLGYLKLINPTFIETYQKEWLTDYQSKSPEKDKWEKYITDMTRMYSKNVLIDEQTLSNIGVNVLLVFGDRDLIKLEHALELYQIITGSRLCVLPNTPHEVFSENPELISNIGIEFLTK
ncbi:MAG: alpha/beta hydrolase [Melioribacteraceae bacterium]|nr:alpha/beta hydrolase [Melioribacteraceae bacterium]